MWYIYQTEYCCWISLKSNLCFTWNQKNSLIKEIPNSAPIWALCRAALSPASHFAARRFALLSCHANNHPETPIKYWVLLDFIDNIKILLHFKLMGLKY